MCVENIEYEIKCLFMLNYQTFPTNSHNHNNHNMHIILYAIYRYSLKIIYGSKSFL